MQMLEVTQNDRSLQGLLVRGCHQKTLTRFKSGKLIVLDTKNLWIVYRGFVQVSTLQASGDESILGLLGPLMPICAQWNILSSYEATALTDVELLPLSIDEVWNSPELLNEINLQTMRHLRQAEALLAITGKRLIIERLLDFLRLLAQEFGQQTAEGVRIDFRLRHYQIANAVGTTRVTATRFLRELREQGVFHVGKDYHMYIQSCSESDLNAPLTR